MRYVYGLGDPTVYSIKYVGQTNNIHRRYAEHIEDDDDTEKVRWIKGLQRRGHQPYIIVLDSCQDNEIDTQEEWWIRFGTSKGWQLTNGTFTGAPRKRKLFGVKHEAVAKLRMVAILIVIFIFLYIMTGR